MIFKFDLMSFIQDGIPLDSFQLSEVKFDKELDLNSVKWT